MIILWIIDVGIGSFDILNTVAKTYLQVSLSFSQIFLYSIFEVLSAFLFIIFIEISIVSASSISYFRFSSEIHDTHCNTFYVQLYNAVPSETSEFLISN